MGKKEENKDAKEKDKITASLRTKRKEKDDSQTGVNLM